MLLHWLWLATRENITDREKALLLEEYYDAEDLYFADPERFQSFPPQTQKSLLDKDLKGARKILDDCTRLGIHILAFRDAGYPARLRNIPDPPVVLYYKGKLLDFDSLPLIGVVGTRKASAYGLTVAKRMGYQIASCGGIVVSGAAFGIDGVAMAGALTAGSPVIAILGSGADIIYPPSNKGLFADTERNGCLLTEFPPGTPPYKWNFPKRNRIISGMSCGVLVVEAPENSGARITAQRALDQGRDVFVVPGNIDVDSCRGSNALLREGATAATSGWDVVGEYAAQYPDKIRKNTQLARQTAYPDEVQEQKVAQKPKLLQRLKKDKGQPEKKEIDKLPEEAYHSPEEESLPLNEQETQIIELIAQGTDLVDDLIAAMQLPAAAVSASLTMLQIKGLVRSLPGKRVALVKK